VRFLVALMALCAASGSLADVMDPEPITSGQNSVKTLLCVPELAGEQYGELAYNTTSLTISILALGPGVHTLFTYTGGDIDDGPGTFAWGNPTTNAVEVDDITTSGALSACAILSIRDDVIDTANATQFVIGVTDGGSALMDATKTLVVYAGEPEIEAALQAVVEANRLDHIAAVAVTGSDVADNSIVAKLVSASATADFDNYDNTTDSLEAQRANVGDNGEQLNSLQANIVNDIDAKLFISEVLTAESGTTTTLVDTALTEATTDYWAKGVAILVTSGSTAGQSSCVTAFTPGTDTLTFSALTAAISTNNYRLISAPACQATPIDSETIDQIAEDACELRAVLVNRSDFDDSDGLSAEFYNRAGNTVVNTTTYSGANRADRTPAHTNPCS
jgi:hypothetical protein